MSEKAVLRLSNVYNNNNNFFSLGCTETFATWLVFLSPQAAKP